MVYNTIPGSLASSPEHNFHVLCFKKFSLFTFQPAYLPRVDLSFHTNLFRNLDAVWFQHQPGDFGNLSFELVMNISTTTHKNFTKRTFL